MAFFLGWLAFIITLSTLWAFDYFGLSCFEQIVFHLKVPLEGANPAFIKDWFRICLFKSLIGLMIYALILDQIDRSYRMVIALSILTVCLIYCAFKIGLIRYLTDQFRNSDLYEQEYSDPNKIKIAFPAKKRNIIHIFAESMEATYFLKEDGGNSSENIIAPLAKLAKENISFSNGDLLGGGNVLKGTGYTTAGIASQHGGIPLFVPLFYPSFKKGRSFYHGAKTLEDILKDEGYAQEFIIGSKAKFGGREFYFDDHGNAKIFDLDQAKKEGLLDKDYHVFWGYEDAKLFAFAQEEITKLSQGDKPWSATILTVDTHHPYGYLDSDVPHLYSDRLSDIIAMSAERIAGFIEWAKSQSWYDDTLIVISGDHTSMAAEYIHKHYDRQYERTFINIFINSTAKSEHFKNRRFASFDMYPTILSALGAQIESGRLGLGTDLFSDRKTLLERQGMDRLQKELTKRSKYYEKKILQ